MNHIADKSLGVVVIIPARGGSKSVPRKNIRNLGGKPLIVWSIDVAIKCSGVNRIFVSTDDKSIAEIARKNGAEVHMRPARLATDESLVIDTVKFFLKNEESKGISYEIVIMLEPTCPFRKAEDVEKCLNMLIDEQYDSVATFSEVETHPHRTWTIDREVPVPFIPGIDPWLPRQKLPKVYKLDGAVYAFRTGPLFYDGKSFLFGKTGAVITDSKNKIDIDSERDFLIAETIIQNRKH